MSRRSFYRHSARHSSTPFVTELDEPVNHWSREWVTPSIDASSDAASGGAVSAANGGGSSSSSSAAQALANITADRDSKNPLGFSVKMWVRVDSDVKPQADGDDDDLLVFQEPVKEVEVVEPKPTEGGLTAADIRGAVGGEVIPGMSSSQYENKDQPKEEGPKEEMTTETNGFTATEPKKTEPSAEPSESVEAPVEAAPSDAPTEVPTETTTEAPTEAPTEVSTEAPTEDVEMTES